LAWVLHGEKLGLTSVWAYVGPLEVQSIIVKISK